MASRLATAALALGVMHSSVVAALGLGELKLQSFLNEPLTATVDILNTGGLHEDQIRVRLATPEDFDKLGIDRAYFLTSVKFEISLEEGNKGKIIVTSQDPVLEPYLDFLIEARWPSGRLLREYTVLVDPPAFDTDSPAVSAGQRVAETEGEAETAKKKTQAAAASSGTQVTTRRPDQESGAATQRDFGTNPSSSPLPGDEYMIRRDETLWGIALKAKPAGTSVHQTMLDIQRMNPDAFIDGNINTIKAGYVIKLPDSGDISSNDTVSAEAAVRLQNEYWREGVASDSEASSGPSLRISAEPTVTESTSAQDADLPVSSASTGENPSIEDSAGVEQERVELARRLSSMEQQVVTLENIVSLKNDQIAALQAALAEAEVTGSDSTVTAEPADSDGASEAGTALQLAREAAESEGQQPAEPAPEVSPETSPPAATVPAVQTPVAAAPAPVAEESGNTLSYLLGLAAIAALGLVFFLLRRKSSKEADETPAENLSRKVAADEKLRKADAPINDLEKATQPKPATQPRAVTPLELAPEPEPVSELQALRDPEPEEDAVDEGDRGYGERKHDEYASDEAGDALAEADIYIAYGRYPQAVDLLKTAIKNEPRNPDYRVKLVEVSAEMGNKEEAQAQYEKLLAIGDTVTISRAENILATAGSVTDLKSSVVPPKGGIDLTADTGEVLEADFGELEIEMTDIESADDDLDLSEDFVDPAPANSAIEDDIVFAADGDEMSTKLDLARAYLDMGDEDGARQILEEVVVEGGSGQVEEAQVLLDRLG